jgi:uncharacterized membrane protein
MQVAANGGAAAFFAGMHLLEPRTSTAAAILASLCAANADTWATEIGVRFGRRPFRVISLAPANAGQSGAITWAGLLAAFLGSALIAAFAPLGGLTGKLPLLTTLGFCGCMLDSVLGDTVQAKYDDGDGNLGDTGKKKVGGASWMTNDVVNFLSVSAAATAAYFAA